MSDHVTRFVITHVSDAAEGRVLTFARQGRCTWATRDEAQAFLDSMRANNAASTLDLITDGARDTLAVRAVPCWPEHFDPVGCFAPDAEVQS